MLENPETKLFNVSKYILMMSDDKSTTWCNHVKLICRQYDLPDPLQLLQCLPLPRAEWKTLIVTKITVYHEKYLRQKAATNSNLQYLNVQLQGLSGRPHPAVLGISETREAYKLRAHAAVNWWLPQLWVAWEPEKLWSSLSPLPKPYRIYPAHTDRVFCNSWCTWAPPTRTSECDSSYWPNKWPTWTSCIQASSKPVYTWPNLFQS